MQACTTANLWAFHPTKPLSDTHGTAALPNCTTKITSHYSKGQFLQFTALIKTLDRICLPWFMFCQRSVLCGETDLVFTIQDRFLIVLLLRQGKEGWLYVLHYRTDQGRLLSLCYSELCFLTEVLNINKTREKQLLLQSLQGELYR